MPPSYQSPSVESVLDPGTRPVVDTTPEPSTDEAANHHTSSDGDARNPPAPKDSATPIGHDVDVGDETASEPRGDDHHPAASAMVSSSPVTTEPHDEPRPGHDRIPRELRNEYGMLYRAPSPSGASALSDLSGSTSMSAGSGGSGSTVTRRTHTGRRGGGERHRHGERAPPDAIPEHYQGDITPRPAHAPWFEPNTPGASPNHQLPWRSFEQQQQQQLRVWQPSSAPGHRHATTGSVSSVGSSLNSEPFSDRSLAHATDGSLSSPDRSEPADSPESRYAHQMACAAAAAAGPGGAPQQRNPFMYIVPPAPPLGSGMPPQPQQQQQLSPGFLEQFPHPPRPDNVPQTGYELLASRLSVNETGAPDIQPMYRRFEALNHRLLLYLQDELMELEDQLRQVDADDTQSRRIHHGLHHGFHPASRREEAMAAAGGAALPYAKTDILGRIGIRLGLYNQVLSSFRETQSLPPPDMADVQAFRDYLASRSPVVGSESRFLEMEEDLASLSRPADHRGFNNSDNLLTPMPRRIMAFPPTPTSPLSEVAGRVSAHRPRGWPGPRRRDEPNPLGTLPLLAGGMASAFFLPILSFMVIPAFVGRLAVVAVMTAAAGVVLLQTGALRHLNGAGPDESGAVNVVVCAGVYGAAMAMLAVLL